MYYYGFKISFLPRKQNAATEKKELIDYLG